MGGLFEDEETTLSPKKLEKKQYFRRLSEGNKLSGKPIGAQTTPATRLSDGDSKKERVEEIVGNARHIYEVDSVTGEKVLIRRLPMRKNLLGPGSTQDQGPNPNKAEEL